MDQALGTQQTTCSEMPTASTILILGYIVKIKKNKTTVDYLPSYLFRRAGATRGGGEADKQTIPVYFMYMGIRRHTHSTKQRPTTADEENTAAYTKDQQ